MYVCSQTIRPIRYNQAMRLLSICRYFLFYTLLSREWKNWRISFDEVEGLEGEKLVLFVSKKDEKASAAKASIKVLRSVKIFMFRQDRTFIGRFSYVLVDCASRKSSAKCEAAGFSNFPRWFIHSVEGGIEELWHPSAQTSESILEFLTFRSSAELSNVAVPSLRSLGVIPHLAFQRPVVVQYSMPWSGRSQRFDKHYRKTYTLQQDQYFFILLTVTRILTSAQLKVLTIILLSECILNRRRRHTLMRTPSTVWTTKGTKFTMAYQTF